MRKIKRLLIVDDSTVSRLILKRELEKEGFQVSTVTNGREAVEEVAKEDFDFLFMDLKMPEMDGYQATVEIRKAGASDLPIIAFSGTVNEEVIKRCRDADMNSCLGKPASKEELLTIIEQFQDVEELGFQLPRRRSKLEEDTVEAVTALQEMGEIGAAEVLPDLFQYIDLRQSDEATAVMARNIAHKLLAGQEDYILLGLEQGGAKTRDICIHHAGEMSLSRAIPSLKNILEKSSSVAEKQTVLVALRGMSDETASSLILDHLDAEDTLLGLSAIAALGKRENRFASAPLAEILEKAEPIRAYAASESLGEIRDRGAILSLANNIHHENSVVRKGVLASLIRIGRDVIAAVAMKLQSTDGDEVIMAANVLGQIGHAASTPALNDLVSHENHNVRFAVYEALGRIKSIKASFSLVEGLGDENYPVVCAALQAIDNNPLPQLVDRVRAAIDKGTPSKERFVEAVVDMRATSLFAALLEDRMLLKAIVDRVAKSRSPETMETFLDATDLIDNELTRTGCRSILNHAIKNLAKGGLKVLAVDDSMTIRYLYDSLLANMGHQVTCARDGQEGVEKLESGSYDLLITDLNMPRKNGIELVKYLKEEMRLDIPVIMVTTESQESQKEEAHGAGADDFLTKPFTASSLESAIKAVMAGH